MATGILVVVLVIRKCLCIALSLQVVDVEAVLFSKSHNTPSVDSLSRQALPSLAAADSHEYCTEFSKIGNNEMHRSNVSKMVFTTYHQD